MQIEFEDDDLQRLYVDKDFRIRGMGSELVGHYRRKLQMVASAAAEPDLRAMRSLNLEKLGGSRTGQFSIRLNDQWRLVLRFRTDGGERVAVVVEVVDYH